MGLCLLTLPILGGGPGYAQQRTRAIRVSAKCSHKLLLGFVESTSAQENLAEQFMRRFNQWWRTRRRWCLIYERSCFLHKRDRLGLVPSCLTCHGSDLQALDL